MTRITIVAGATLLLLAPAAFAQTAVVTPDGTVAVVRPVEPGLVTGASGGTPAGTNANPATAFPRSSETTGNSGLLGGQTAEQHEKFGN